MNPTFAKIFDQLVTDDHERTPNLLGEMLRAYCFLPDKQGNNFGCYDTFRLREEFRPLTSDDNAADHLMVSLVIGYDDKESEKAIQVFSDGDILIAWSWYDGDGILVFHIKSADLTLLNSDCKKDYGWDFYQ